MTLKAGQLRSWIARDATGGIHEADFSDMNFMVICDPYENNLGQKMVDLLDGGQVHQFMEAEHVEFWSLLVND